MMKKKKLSYDVTPGEVCYSMLDGQLVDVIAIKEDSPLEPNTYDVFVVSDIRWTVLTIDCRWYSVPKSNLYTISEMIDRYGRYGEKPLNESYYGTVKV